MEGIRVTRGIELERNFQRDLHLGTARSRRRLGRPVLFVLIAILGASLAISLLGRISCSVAGLDLTIRVGVGSPGTSLELPPLGAATAVTHLSPLSVSMRLNSVDPDAMLGLAGHGAGAVNTFSSLLEEEARRVLPRLAVMVLLLGAAGGAFLVYAFVRPARPKHVFAGFLIGLLYSLLLMAGAYLTFDASSFKRARYSGVIEAAPWVLGVLDRSVTQVGELNTTIKTIADNASLVFRQIESLQPVLAGGRLVRVLHVSDLHDGTQAVRFIAQLVKSFNVDLIVDTGDITDYGTKVELEFTGDISSLPVPYVFIGGNHDSPEVLQAIAHYPNVRLAGGSAIGVSGITLLGIDDPGASRSTMEASSDAEISAAAERGRTILGGLERSPDLLMTHDPRLAEAFCGRVPVVLHGHDHKLQVRTVDGTVVVDAGSTGGAGIRGFTASEEVPMTVALLHFLVPDGSGRPGTGQMGAGARLVAVDTITLSQFKGGFTLERRFVNSPDKEKQG